VSEVPPFAAPPPVLDINETSTFEGFEVLRGTRGAWGRSEESAERVVVSIGGHGTRRAAPVYGYARFLVPQNSVRIQTRNDVDDQKPHADNNRSR